MRRALALLGCLAGASCDTATEPDFRPPYLAIVPRVATVPGMQLPTTVRYRIRLLTTPGGLDTIVRAGLRDTVVLSLPPSTYEVERLDVPSRCALDPATPQEAVLFPNTNTTVVRLNLACQPSLVVTFGMEGEAPRAPVVFEHVAPGAASRTRSVSLTDTLVLDALAPGAHRLGVSALPSNCLFVSPGGADTQPVDVPAAGGVRAELRVHCALAAQRPQVRSFGASVVDTTVAFTLRATDPDRNLDRYVFDLTDCAGRSRFPTGARSRTGLLPAFGPSADTSVVVAAFDAEVPRDTLLASCLAVRVIDRDGNSSAISSRRLGPPIAARAPVLQQFDAFFVTRDRMDLVASATDPDGDLEGSFVLLQFRDGSITGVFDGRPDVGILNTIGFPRTMLPTVPAGAGRPQFEDYAAVALVVVDRAGNATRRVDTRLVP